MPNPLTDELSSEAKAELAAMFSALRRVFPPVEPVRIRTKSGYQRVLLPKQPMQLVGQ